MRTDLTTARHDAASHDEYVYGSAEVVGLMCLRVFVNAGAQHPIAPAADLVDGARRLGAAFQDVNFLRDLDHDETALGRDYLGVSGGAATRTEVLDRIDADLAAAAATIPRLPTDCRRAVTAAHDLFAELSARLRRSTPDQARVRVPDAVKARLAARALLGFGPRESRG
jgi:phytoene/squalene synthetase